MHLAMTHSAVKIGNSAWSFNCTFPTRKGNVTNVSTRWSKFFIHPRGDARLARQFNSPDLTNAQRIVTRTPTSVKKSRNLKVNAMESLSGQPVPSGARRVAFLMESKLQRGVNVVLVGNCDALGNWSESAGVPLAQLDGFGTTFGVMVDVPANQDIEYKFMVQKEGKREHAWRWLEDASYVLAVGEHGPHEAHLLDLEVKTPIQFGERIMIVGSSEQLGNWDMQHGHELVWHEGHIWRGQVQYNPNEKLEYKFVIVRDDCTHTWQTGVNYTMAAVDAPCSRSHIVHQEWTPPVWKHEEMFAAMETRAAWTAGWVEGAATRRAVVLVKAELDWDESLHISGSCDALGHWEVERMLPLEWTVGDVWLAELDLPQTDVPAFFKIVIKNDNGEVTWQPGYDVALGEAVEIADAVGASKEVFLAAIIGQQYTAISVVAEEGGGEERVELDAIDMQTPASASLETAMQSTAQYLDAVKHADEGAAHAAASNGEAASSQDPAGPASTPSPQLNPIDSRRAPPKPREVTKRVTALLTPKPKPDAVAAGPSEGRRASAGKKPVPAVDPSTVAGASAVLATVAGVETTGLDLLVASEPAMMAGAALMAGTFMVNNLLYAKDRERLFAAATNRKAFAQYVNSGGLWKRAGTQPTVPVPGEPPKDQAPAETPDAEVEAAKATLEAVQIDEAAVEQRLADTQRNRSQVVPEAMIETEVTKVTDPKRVKPMIEEKAMDKEDAALKTTNGEVAKRALPSSGSVKVKILNSSSKKAIPTSLSDLVRASKAAEAKHKS